MSDSADVNAPQVIGAATAPVIFFDGVAAFGVYNGTIEIEAAMRVLTPLPEGKTRGDALIVARLRLNPAGFAALKEVIQKLELMMAPGDTKPN